MDAIGRAGDSVADMSYFTSRDERPGRYCADVVSECDVYVAIIGHRYGSPVLDRPDISYVQLEFEAASHAKIKRLIFMLDDAAPFPPILMDEPAERRDRQLRFRKRLLSSGLTVAKVKSPGELETRLYQALLDLRHNPDSPAWSQPELAASGSLWADDIRDYSQIGLAQVLAGDDQEFFSIALAPTKDLVAAGSSGQVLIWHRDSPSTPTVVEGYGRYVYSVAFSADGTLLASGDEGGGVRVLDVASGEFLWAQEYSSEGHGMGHREGVYSVAFSPDGKLVASGGYDREVKIWYAATGRLRRQKALSGRVSSVSFDRHSRLLAIGNHDNSVSVWDLPSGELRPFPGHTSSVESVAFSPVSDLLVSGGLDKFVRLWDVADAREKWTGRGHEYLVRSVAFSPDGATVASAGWDKTVRLWETETGDCVQQLPWDRESPFHTDWIWAVAFSPDGSMFATAGSDSKVILWRVQLEKVEE
jgi:WD40 repeat protein